MQILLRWGEGDQEAVDHLFPAVYEVLKGLAHARVRQERSDHTLNATALVHEAYIKLVDLDRVHWKARAHFFTLASRRKASEYAFHWRPRDSGP